MHARVSASALAPEAPGSPDGPDGLLVEPGVVRYFQLENVAVVAWYAAPTVHAIEELYRLGEPYRRRYPRGGSVVHVLCGDRLSVMDGPARDALVRVTDRLGPQTAAVAVVLAVDGFLASAARSVITGLRVRTKYDYEYRMHARCSEVLAWLPQANQARTGLSVDPQRLLALLEHASSGPAKRRG